jgi:serine/threonine-protein kinase
MSDWPAGAPRRLGRYEVVAEIARGGMGTVYLARRAGEAGFQRLFAIKLMHPHLEEDHHFVDMLLDEARIAARIHHPNVVAILDLGLEEGRHFVVLEYVDGAAFSVLLMRSKEARPPQLIVPIMIDTLEGLSAAHSLTDDDGLPLHLVHRDVSPQNILVGADGIGRITDFGIAKAEARITSTRPGMRKGKIHYMAPEQLIEDGDNIDLRADVFAAGAVLWGSLTGRSLFRGQNDAATVHNVLSKEVPPPSTVGFHPPAAFDAVCLRALERDPEKRFQSALEMADALRRAAAAHGLVSSHSAIASWVGETLGDELEARRQAIRTVASPSQGFGSMESLPELPTLGPVSAGSLSPTYPNAAASLEVPTRPATPVSQTQPTATIHSLNVEPMPGLRAGRRRALIVGGALLVPLLIGATWLATRSSDQERSAAQTSSSATLQTAPPEPAPKASENAEPPAPASAAESSAPVESTTEPAHKPRHVARLHRHAKPTTQKTTPAASAAPKPSSAPPPATAKPPSNTGTGVPFENNPYLRK